MTPPEGAGAAAPGWRLPPGVPRGGPDIGDDPVAARDAAAAQIMAVSAALADGFRAVVPGAVERQVRALLRAWGRLDPDARGRAEVAAREAGARAGADLAERWAREAALPLTEQRHGPLAVLRDARRYGTAVLAAAGVPPVRRDPFLAERFPDDVYGLVLERFADLPGGEDMHALHLAWGVARARWVKAEQAVRAAGPAAGELGAP